MTIEHIVSFPLKPAGLEPKYSRRRVAIVSALATGWLPWGIQWQPFLPLCGNEYILCCGHVLRRHEAQQFVDAGVLKAGLPDRFNRPTLVIGDKGEVWLGGYWA